MSDAAAHGDVFGRPIDIDNAGLVLFAPFLTILFERLTERHRPRVDRVQIAGLAARMRMVHLLQYLVDGRTETPVHRLALNKLLAGVNVNQPIKRSIAMTTAERMILDGLVEAIIAQWPAINGSSTDALRTTFLKREGRLQFVGNGWRLTVPRKTTDALVDQVAWQFSTVFNPVMKAPIYVTW